LKAQNYIAQYIISKLDSPDTIIKEVYSIETNGVHQRKGTYFFRAGQTIIWPAGKESAVELKLKPLSQEFVFDCDKYCEGTATAGMVKLIGLAPGVGRVAFSHALSGVMRSLFIEAGITPCTILQVVGEFNSLKTTYIPFLTQMYDRHIKIKPATRLNSTKNYIERLLHKNVDNTVIIDDYRKEEKGNNQNQATFEQIIRIMGDCEGKGRMIGNTPTEHSPNCIVITLGEDAYGDKSTASRSLIVNLTERIDPVKLHEIQSNETLLPSTFLYYYLQWIIDNREMICGFFKESLTEFREFHFDIKLRLRETFFVLNSSWLLFLQYCVEKGFTDTDDAEELLDDFQKHLKFLVFQQHNRSVQGLANAPNKVDYLKLIQTLYEQKRFRIAGSKKEFRKWEHDGLLKDNCLCLLSDNLLEKVRREIPAAALDNVIDALYERGALDCGNAKDKKYTKQIGFGSDGNRKNIRFYHILLSKLKQ
jgi:hypothetical protein